MSAPTEQPTARILDFVEYRQRRARARWESGAPRRFLWGWPSTGQLTVVNFPAPSGARFTPRSQIL